MFCKTLTLLVTQVQDKPSFHWMSPTVISDSGTPYSYVQGLLILVKHGIHKMWLIAKVYKKKKEQKKKMWSEWLLRIA